MAWHGAHGRPRVNDTPQAGLSEAEAKVRLQRDGPNELPAQRGRGGWRLLIGVVTEPMFLLLVACGGVYLILGDKQEALMLLGFVVVVMGISLVQQQRTAKALSALRELSSPRALVVRDGQTRRVAGRELVCGDTVLLSEGDRVPCDLRLVEAANFVVDESALTGESEPVMKHADGPQPAFALAGTLVTQGTARGEVSATGPRSALGRIGASLASLGDEATPIQRETTHIVKLVASVGLGLALLLALAWWGLKGELIQGVLAGLTLAMAILPEELPVMLTLFMGLGAWRLSRAQVLARSIPAVELLGATTVLCVDKTGTLTVNRMAVRRLWNPQASFDAVSAGSAPLPEALHGLLEYAVLASHRRAVDPMEAAVAEAGQRLLAGTEHLHADWTLVEDYPLSRSLLAMSRVWQSPDQHERLIAAKGAPEAIVDLCHLDAAQAALISAQVATLAADGLRVLGVAQARFAAPQLPEGQHDFDFEFLGLIALQDPVRADVPQAIAECQAAGMRVVMITGDHPATALSIARQAGLQTKAGALSGSELDPLGDAALQVRLADTNVFCRVSPEQKLRLVQAFRARGDIVAMTGDGVNDAPALKAAHIGVAMGARGTDVAREAAALVLLKDDFASLVTAVRHGRRVFANLRKAVAFVVAVHVPIVGLSLLPVLLGWPMLLMPVHILSLQLVIDPACAVVFEAEPLEEGAMRRPPRRPDARLFDRDVLVRGLWQGCGLLLILLAVFAGARQLGQSDNTARALTFMALLLASLALIQCNRSWGRAARTPSLGGGNQAFAWVGGLTLAGLAAVLAVPPLSALFAFALPPPAFLLAGVGAALLAWGWFELVKRVLSPSVAAPLSVS